MKMRLYMILLVALLLLSGCSTKVLLPYEENSLCQRGANEGLCGSVSDIYKETIRSGK